MQKGIKASPLQLQNTITRSIVRKKERKEKKRQQSIYFHKKIILFTYPPPPPHTHTHSLKHVLEINKFLHNINYHY